MLNNLYSLETLRTKYKELSEEALRRPRKRPPDSALFGEMRRLIRKIVDDINKERRRSKHFDFYRIDGFDPILKSLEVCAMYRHRIKPIFWPWLCNAIEKLGDSSRYEIHLAINKEIKKTALRNKNKKGKSFSDHVTHSVLTCIFGEDLLNSGSFGKRGSGGARFLCDFLTNVPAKGIVAHCQRISGTTIQEDTIKQAWYIAALSHDAGYRLYGIKEEVDDTRRGPYRDTVNLLSVGEKGWGVGKLRITLLGLFGFNNELEKLVEKIVGTLDVMLRRDKIDEKSHAPLGAASLVATIEKLKPYLCKRDLLTVFLSFIAVYSHEDHKLTEKNMQNDPLTTFLKMIDELEVWGRVYYGSEPTEGQFNFVRCLPCPQMHWAQDHEGKTCVTYFPSKECKLNPGISEHKCGWNDDKFWKSRKDLEKKVDNLSIFPNFFKIERGDPCDVNL